MKLQNLRQTGMTLLELMIVITILAVLTVYSSTSIQQAIKSRKKIDKQVSDFSQIRDALKILERDINMAFHYTDLEQELKDRIREQRRQLVNGGPATPNTGGDPTASTTTTQAPLNTNPALMGMDSNGCYGDADPLCVKAENRADPSTQFVGKENELNFVTMNSARVNEQNPVADFVKVGYSVRSCRQPGQEKGSNCLLRRTSAYAEGDVTKGGDEIVLLQNVSEFKFRYIGAGKQDWVSDWNTIQGDAAVKGKFPQSVEVSITVEEGEGEKKRKISMQIVAGIRFPNNPEEKKDQQKPGT